MLRWIVVVVVAAMVAGCATLNYLKAEYGSADKDGTVTLPDGTGWWVWQHKSKSKLIISADPAQAAQMGLVAGLTFGGASGAIPPPVFEQVGKQWLAQAGRGNCRLAGGYPIDRMYYEFDVACDPPSVARR